MLGCSTVGLGNGGGCHPDPDGTEKSCRSYNTTLVAMGVGYRAFHDALSVSASVSHPDSSRAALPLPHPLVHFM